MQSYLDLVGRGRIDVQPLIDRVISVDEAPGAYRALAQGTTELPLGVLIRYRTTRATSRSRRTRRG
jgi:threonine dehydrogenase-like Zn-dependent dehydrogenase